LKCWSLCSDDSESTGEAAWVGYIGPFKARDDAIDMSGRPKGDTMWNGWPSTGNELMRAVGSMRRGHAKTRVHGLRSAKRVGGQ
jgi:hypothetical protein